MTAVHQGLLRYSHTIGLSTMEGRGYYYPSATAVGGDGRIYTVSRSLEGDTRGVRVTVTDLDSNFYGTFASYGEEEGELIWPTAIVIDRNERLHIADERTNRISVYDLSGTFLYCWGETGGDEGQLDGPSGLALDEDGNLAVADHQNHRVQRFTTFGDFISCFGSKGAEDGCFNLPWGVAMDSQGSIYVADWGNDRVQKLSVDGEVLGRYGSPGRGDGEFNRPADVAVDKDGYIYVADWGNHRVQVLTSNGGFVMKLRGEATESKWARDFLDINVEEATARAESDMEPDVPFARDDPHEESWHVEKYFWAPTSVTLDADGRLYVTESNRHRIQVYERA